MRLRRGFTLIELLVVIALIAILAAILFPVISAAKDRGRQAKCLNNLRQLSIALQFYVDDNDGKVPWIAPYDNDLRLLPGTNWCGTYDTYSFTDPSRGSLFRYVRAKEVYICPSDARARATGCKNLSADDQAAYPLSYSLNGEFNQNDLTGQMRSSSPQYPVNFEAAIAGKSSIIILFWHEGRTMGPNGVPQGINDGLNLWAYLDYPARVHFEGTTCSYADCHARWVSFKELVAEHDSHIWLINNSKTTSFDVWEVQ